MSAVLWTQVVVTRLFLGGLINAIKVFIHANGLLFRQSKTQYIVVGCGTKADLFLSDIKKEKNVSIRDITFITGVPSDGEKKD